MKKSKMNISQGEQLGVVLCSPSYVTGGNWGYLLSSHNDYQSFIPALKQAQENLKLIQAANGLIVLIKEDFLDTVVGSTATEKEKELAKSNRNTRKAEERIKVMKFLEGIVQGTTKYGVQCDGFKEYAIGIYSSNFGNKIQVNGVEYPAFRVPVKEMLEFLVQLQRFKDVYVKVKDSTGVHFLSLTEIIPQDASGFMAITSALDISETQTGVFITIRV